MPATMKDTARLKGFGNGSWSPSIAHLITVEKLYEAFRSLRKNASAGIDGVTYAEYETNAEENIRQLHRRLVAGKYQAQPLRRVYIPKENGKQRPISFRRRCHPVFPVQGGRGTSDEGPTEAV
jgi:hypothetical protein